MLYNLYIKEMLVMKINKPVISYLAMFIVVLFLLQMAGCGTILYPERRGQKAGRVDAGVAILDGLGLLVFIIPGVIAFAVDFTTGAIYLPGGKSKRARGLEHDNLAMIKMNPGDLNLATLDEILLAYTGEEVNLDSEMVMVYEADKDQSIEAQLSKVAQ
jgi:hypothetical protein